MKKVISVIATALFLTSCTSNGIPAGAVLWCGSFAFTGTMTKTETEGVAIGSSDPEIARAMTVESATELATAMGCGRP